MTNVNATARLFHYRWLSAGLAACLPLLVACSDEHGEGTSSGSTCTAGSDLTYESFGRAFMTSYCTRCHSSSLSGSARNGAPSDHNFDTPEGVRAAIDHIDERAAAGPDSINEEMPNTDPRPTEDERRKLGEWLACGAP